MKNNSCTIVGYTSAEFCFQQNERHPLFTKIKDEFVLWVKQMYKTGVREFYFGNSTGVDLWIGEVLLSISNDDAYRDINMHCISVVGANCEFNDNSAQRQEKVLRACQEVYVLPRANYTKVSSVRRRAYYNMIDRSQYVLAVCRSNKGERNEVMAAVKYAIKRKKQVTLLHPETLKKTDYLYQGCCEANLRHQGVQ